MASRILEILSILVVIWLLVLVQADRYRRDDSSGESGSSSEQPIRRRLPNRRSQIDQRNGRPNGIKGSGPRANQRYEGRSNPTSQTRGTSVGNNKRQNLAKGGNRNPESILRTYAKTIPSSQKQSTPRRNLPVNDRNNKVEGKKKKTPVKPNTNKKRRTPRQRTNKRSFESSSFGCCSSSKATDSEQIPQITPSTKSPTAGVPPISEESQETSISDDAGEKDHSIEDQQQLEDPRGNDSKEDETTENGKDGDREGESEETEDDITTVDNSAGYTIPTDIATVTIVSEFITSNNTFTETTTPPHRNITETTTLPHRDVTETATPTNRHVTETTTPPHRDVTETTNLTYCDVLPPVSVKRERSIVFCAADRQRNVSYCPCLEKMSLPVLPQFPMTECKFRKTNDIANPIGIKAVEENKRNTTSHTLASYVITIVALMIVSFTV